MAGVAAMAVTHPLARCPACWTPLPRGASACAACGSGATQPVPRRPVPGWLIGVLSAAAGASVTLWWVSRSGDEPVRQQAAPTPPPAASKTDPAPPAAPQTAPTHTVDVFDASGTRVGTALLLRADPAQAAVGFLPLERLPLRGDPVDSDGHVLANQVQAVAEAYGFVLLAGLDATGRTPLRPRRAPILNDSELVVAGGRDHVRVLGRSPASANELLLDAPCADGAVLVDTAGDVAALGLGSTNALAVTPVWSWLDARAPAQPLARVQAELRARDPAALLEDVAREIGEAKSADATRAALDRLEVGFALARGAEMVAAYDRALRHGHRLLAQRLAAAGDARGAFDHARRCLLRFPADADLLGDAIVLAAGADEYQAAADLWLELRSRDPVRAQEHGAGLADALMRAADDRVARSPREAVEILARGVDLFPDRADLRMSYAGALLQSGDGDGALWQARLAADRDASLLPRLEAIAARTPASGAAVEIPIAPDSHVVGADCAVAGRSLQLVVDTGASITVLPAAFAALGRRTGRRVRIQTASGEVEAELVRYSELRIGSITVTHITAASLDLPGTLAGKGLLGMNVLRRLNMQIDNARDVLVLRR